MDCLRAAPVSPWIQNLQLNPFTLKNFLEFDPYSLYTIHKATEPGQIYALLIQKHNHQTNTINTLGC